MAPNRTSGTAPGRSAGAARDLEDKIAIVTGPAKGMGRAITLALARAGAHRGRIVMDNGELVGEKGWDRPVRQSMPAPRPHNTDKTSAAIVHAPRF